MSRTAIPLRVDDLSPFAKTLRQSLSQHEGTPTHVELLNLIAKAAGFANYQHLRVFWSRIPRGEVFTEREISDLIRDWHAFGDHALIRRAMVDAKMLERTVDGREYRRIEQAPPAELEPLLVHLAERARA
jgi:hypothetical protein